MESSNQDSDLCWCGSGLLFQSCHKDREKQTPPTLGEIIEYQRKAFGKKRCFHPDAPTNCTKIIRAHTIQKGGNLAQIARNGHVYSVSPDLKSLIENNGLLTPTLRGISQVSTINGFCGHHDASFFSPIENRDFNWEPEQCFLLIYRSLSRELYGKLSLFDQTTPMRNMDKGKDLATQQYFQRLINTYELGAQIAIRDLNNLKSQLDAKYTTQDYSDIRYFGFEFGSPPDVLCSVGMTPAFDMSGLRLQNLNDTNTRVQYLSFNLFAENSKGFAVFSWLPPSDIVATRFISSLDLIDNSHIPDALIRICFNESDNLAISPGWWEQLAESDKQKLLNRLRQDADPYAPKFSLADDGLRVARFKWLSTNFSS